MITRPASLKAYWARNLFLVGCLLVLWLLISLLPLALAYLPARGALFGWPLPFALTAFAVPLVYLLLIGIYAMVMARRDAAALKEASVVHDVVESEDPASDE
jgi:putative solute:sodium symporter small subunit